MAKLYMFSRRRFYGTLSATYLCLIFMICLKVSTESSVGKNRNEGDFHVSIKTVNGKVHISWDTSSVWQNTTVYFLSNLYDNVTNTPFAVSIAVCNASISHDKSWKIEPTGTNLLEFCNKSRKCGPVDGKTSLVKATGTQELSCELFTTCANFDDVYSIRVVSIGGGKEYSFQSGNMTILSENILPFREVKEIDFNGLDGFYKDGISANDPVFVKYFESSQLCGFGANLTDNIQFVFKHYRVNETGCFFMGQKTASYTGVQNTLLTPDHYSGIKIGDIEVFDFTVKFLKNKKTTSWQRFEFKIDTNAEYKKQWCNIIGSVIHIKWRPLRSCRDGEDTKEQARFCFYNFSTCYPVCEASFFANGTFRGVRTYNNTYNEIRDGCNKRSGCSLQNRTKDVKFITVSWSPETQTVSCTLFRTCMDYPGTFSIKIFSINDERDEFRSYVCHPLTQIAESNTPAVPRDVRIIDVQARQFTVTWKSPKCDFDHTLLGCKVIIDFGDVIIEVLATDNTKTDGVDYFFNYTRSSLLPNQEVKFKLFTSCNVWNRGKSTPTRVFKVLTKPSAPDVRPHSLRITGTGRDLEISWKYSEGADLNGVPNETRIEGKDENGIVVFWKSVYRNEKSTRIRVNKTQRCAQYRVKICNAPKLCSEFSDPYQMPICGGPTEPNQPPIEDTNLTWILIASSLGLLFTVAVILAITYVLYQKRRKKTRSELPELEPENDKTGNYTPVATEILTQTGMYNTLDNMDKFGTSLDKEECLEELSRDTEVSGLHFNGGGTSC
ncbi:uncharacterized protein LOC114523141 [Dendronephthya gigantea]|uniref:uncharacterized protein LOC114523141 n=1 Tax=Dendronephthya gigantea TaxID=151771 RepID=UPI00106B81B1|nr:uncharacterized protein LOC114523141 [Dendronephthya gigantea]